MHILVVAAGSAGRRHARNLAAAVGARISCVDPREDRLQQAKAEVPGVVHLCRTLEEALGRESRYDGAVVASPPVFHHAQGLALIERRLPLLLEKPPTMDLVSTLALRDAATAARVPVLLGYTYRWWPPFVELQHRLQAGAIGTPRHARMVMSAHLADWHPWERYEDFFMASREQGGGALLDESHFVDLMLRLFGQPESLFGRVERLSALEISSDDNVDVLAAYAGGLRVSIHLDLYGRPHERSVTIAGDGGTLQALFDPPRVQVAKDAAGTWDATLLACERNDMFVAEAREFAELVRGALPRARCTLDDGVAVMRCIEAIRLSHARRAVQGLDGPAVPR